MLVFEPNKPSPQVTQWAEVPSPQFLHDKVGGWLEAVPGFRWIEHDGKWHRCAALCNEEGKLRGLRTNSLATVLWDQALRHDGGPGLMRPGGVPADILVGNVVVLFGDQRFMEEL